LISFSLNIDLATGKAFLAGGGGGVGEWVKLNGTVTSGNFTFDVYYNKKQKLLSYEIRLTRTNADSATDTTITLSDSPFSVSKRFIVARQMGFFGVTNKPMICRSVTLSIETNGSMRILNESLGYSLVDGKAETTGLTSLEVYYNGTVHVPDENWL
jgi:hypothetical protein